jgi:hypothetical protein
MYIELMTLSAQTLLDSRPIVLMPKSSYPLPEDALPKIHLALEERAAPALAAHRFKKSSASLGYDASQEHQLNPALMYAGAIMGNKQTASTAALSSAFSSTSALRMMVFMGAIIALLGLGVATIRAIDSQEGAELSFDPARISQEFERSLTTDITSSPPHVTPVPTHDEAEENPDLDTIPRRRVMVVTEGDREQLLDTLKTPTIKPKDAETIETYILNPPPQTE